MDRINIMPVWSSTREFKLLKNFPYGGLLVTFVHAAGFK